MRALAVGVTTLLAFGIGGCAEQESITVIPNTVEAKKEAKKPDEATFAAVEPLGEDAPAGAAKADPAALLPSVPELDGSGRDAKEATEAAARRIYEITRSAALKLREVGRDAVHSVRGEGAEPIKEPPLEAAPAADAVSAGG